jgi:hypothetical protein
MFAPDELIAALADAGVEYVLIGGLAVAAHGFPRATKNVHIVPAPDAPKLQRTQPGPIAPPAHGVKGLLRSSLRSALPGCR